MEERGMNMIDVREQLGVKSVKWRIEKRVLERIGHVMRMDNKRLTKIMVLGWYKGLEGTDKMKGRKRKTVLYWKRLMREAGWDYTEVERLANDRKKWKSMVMERMKHLEQWEKQQGHRYEWAQDEERLNRNVEGETELVCRYEGCGEEFRNKAAMIIHEKRLHRAAADRVRFPCKRCGTVLETEAARINHERACRGDAVLEDGRRECGRCGSRVKRSNFARHARTCRAREEGEEAEEGRDQLEEPRYLGRTGNCRHCGREYSYANLARHEKRCLVWDPGGGANPV